MLTIHCKNCNQLIGDSSLFCFYQQSINSYHLTIKLEKRNDILKRVLIVEQEIEKRKKFIPSNLFCVNVTKCATKLGSESTIGPKAENIFCFKAESIYFINNKSKLKLFIIIFIELK